MFLFDRGNVFLLRIGFEGLSSDVLGHNYLVWFLLVQVVSKEPNSIMLHSTSIIILADPKIDLMTLCNHPMSGIWTTVAVLLV